MRNNNQVTFELTLEQREHVKELCEDIGMTASDVLRQAFIHIAKQKLAEPKNETKRIQSNVRMSKEERNLIGEACRHSRTNIAEFFQTFYEGIESNRLPPYIQKPVKTCCTNPDLQEDGSCMECGACCQNENRNNNGGCRSCGAPCY